MMSSEVEQAIEHHKEMEGFLVNLPLSSTDSAESESELHNHHHHHHHDHHTISLIEEEEEGEEISEDEGESKIFTANANPRQLLTSSMIKSRHGRGGQGTGHRLISAEHGCCVEEDEDSIILLEPAATIEVDIEVDHHTTGGGVVDEGNVSDDIIHLVEEEDEEEIEENEQKVDITVKNEDDEEEEETEYIHMSEHEHHQLQLQSQHGHGHAQENYHVQVHLQHVELPSDQSQFVEYIGPNHHHHHHHNSQAPFTRQFEIHQIPQHPLGTETTAISDHNLRERQFIHLHSSQTQQQFHPIQHQQQHLQFHPIVTPRPTSTSSFSTVSSSSSSSYDEEELIRREAIAQSGRLINVMDEDEDTQPDFNFIQEFWRSGPSTSTGVYPKRLHQFPFVQQQYPPQHSSSGPGPSLLNNNHVGHPDLNSDNNNNSNSNSNNAAPIAKYMLYLHDCDPSSKVGAAWPSNLLALKEKTVDGQFKIYHLNLDDLHTKMSHDLSQLQLLQQQQQQQSQNQNPSQNGSKINGQSHGPTIKHPPMELWLDARDSNITLPHLQPLFALIGPYITHFSFGLPHVSWAIKISPQEFSSFLTTFVPNLTHLCFNYTMNTTDKHAYSPPLQPPLEKLRILRFYHPFMISYPVITQIIRGAPNLEKIYGYPFIHLKSMANPRHILLLKSFSYPSTIFGRPLPGNQDNFNRLAAISSPQYRCSLEELKIFVLFRILRNTESFRTMRNSFSSLLISSQATLRRLEIQPLELIGFIDFPVLRELRTLQFIGEAPAAQPKSTTNKYKRRKTMSGGIAGNHHHHQNNNSGDSSSSSSTGAALDRPNYFQFFPNRYNVNQVFPRVSRIEMAVEIPDEVTHLNCCTINKGNSAHYHSTNSERALALFEEYFPPDTFYPGVFPHVRHLTISAYMPSICMDRLGARTNGIFHRISTLVLELNICALAKVLPMVFSLWPQLLKLIVQIDLSLYPSQNLDSVITGIVPGKCEQLRNYFAEQLENGGVGSNSNLAPGSGAPEAIDADVEQYRTLPSICNMKELRVLRFIFDNSRETCLPHEFITQVTGAYALKFLPQLKVSAEFHENCRQSGRDAILKVLEPIRPFITIES